MAKGNYGVNALGGGAGTENSGKGTSLSGKGVSRVSKQIAVGGFLPGVFEQRTNAQSAKNRINSIADIAKNYNSQKNDVATTFRKSKKNKSGK